MLPVLAEAGVVDAGAAGLVEILRGIAGVVAGEPLPEPEHAPTLGDRLRVHQQLSEFRYCTVFVVEADGLDADELERELEALGDSLLVVGDRNALKVHVHTDDPGRRSRSVLPAERSPASRSRTCTPRRCEREERLLHAVPDHAVAVARRGCRLGPGNRRLSRAWAPMSSTAAAR